MRKSLRNSRETHDDARASRRNGRARSEVSLHQATKPHAAVASGGARSVFVRRNRRRNGKTRATKKSADRDMGLGLLRFAFAPPLARPAVEHELLLPDEEPHEQESLLDDDELELHASLLLLLLDELEEPHESLLLSLDLLEPHESLLLLSSF
jgi:hypothetical protein